MFDIQYNGIDIKEWVDKFLILLIAVVVGLLLSRWLARLVDKALDRSQVPDATIFSNLTKAAVWIVAILCVLQPVFNISPNALITTLGAASIAISLGLQDTISNLIGGLALMINKIVKPGDYITVNGITGRVQDVTWRSTTVQDRVGNTEVIPNSVLNKSAITLLTKVLAHETSLDLVLKPDVNTDAVCRELIQTVDTSLGSHKGPAETVVRLTGISGTGINATVYFHVKEGITFANATDLVVRSLQNADYIV